VWCVCRIGAGAKELVCEYTQHIWGVEANALSLVGGINARVYPHCLCSKHTVEANGRYDAAAFAVVVKRAV